MRPPLSDQTIEHRRIPWHDGVCGLYDVGVGLLGDALELAVRCPTLWRTAQLTVAVTSDPARQMRAIERAQSNFGLRRTSPPGDPWARPTDRGLCSQHAKITAASKDRYRIESRQVDPPDG